jgi:CRP-like cAMP-binding protein
MNGFTTDHIPPPPPPCGIIEARLERVNARLAAILRVESSRSNRGPCHAGQDTAIAASTRRPIRPELADVQPKRANRGIASRVSLLSSLWPFSELPHVVLAGLARQMREKRLPAGRRLIRQGGRGRRLLVVMEGSVTVCVRERSRRHVVARLKPGAIIGEMAALTGARRTATVSATTPVRVALISAARFRRLAIRYPLLNSTLGYLVASRLGHSPVDALMGKILHGYRLCRCAGRGAMGIVYKARHLASGRRVALKMLSHRFACDVEVQKRFDREIEICRSLSHPNFARLLDHFAGFGTHVMVLEYCRGTTLKEHIRRHGPMSEAAVRRVAGQLAAALSYLHRRGVCHRDVKPGNIMIAGEQGEVRLMDFGLAKSASSCELTHHQYILGTPGYMPPEQIGGETVDYRADLFALGCVVYEMLTGTRLFAGNDISAILAHELAWSLPPADAIRPGLSEDLHRFFRQTIAARPEDRTVDLDEIGRLWS